MPTPASIRVEIAFDEDLTDTQKKLFVGCLREELLEGGDNGQPWGMGAAKVCLVEDIDDRGI